MATGVSELLEMLYDQVNDAKNVPLSSDKCIIERDKTMELIEEIRNSFPAELDEAKKLMAVRNDYLTSAKREGDMIIRQAQEKAKQILANDELMAQARQRGQDMLRKADERSRELKRAANEYCEDALMRTEEAVAAAYEEIKKSRSRFRAAAAGISNPVPNQSGGGQIFDAQAENN